MTEELLDIHDDLRTCLTLLSESGKAYQDGSIDDMSAQLAAMAPLLERTVYALGDIIEGRAEKEKIDLDDIDEDLKDTDYVWGVTVTGKKWPFISDSVTILRRSGVSNQGFIEDIEKPPNGVTATLTTIERHWNKILNSNLLLAQWGGLNNETNKAFFDTGSYWVEVSANRIALIREITLFDRVEVSFDEQAIVFWKTGDPEPVAMMLYEGEKKSSYEKIRTDHRPSRSG